MEYGQIRGTLNAQISLLKQLEKAMSCIACSTKNTVFDSVFNYDDCTVYGYLTINGLKLGDGVVQSSSIEDFVTALNAAYDGFAVFVLNEDNSLTITINNNSIQNIAFESGCD